MDINNNTYFDSEFDSQSTELLNFSVSNNHEYLFVRIKLGNEIDLTETYFNLAKLFIYIDADNNNATGFYTNNIGSEYGINFFEKFIFDDSNENIVDTLSFYDLDVIPLPTITSDEFEIAINRSMFSDTIAISIKESIGNDKCQIVWKYLHTLLIIQFPKIFSLLIFQKMRILTYDL